MEIFPSESAIGGGSLPGETIPTVALKINAHSMQMNAMKIQSLLREFDHPIVARIENDDVIIDPRTILPESDGHITLALQRIFN